MEVKAVARFVRISPTKVRKVAKAVKGRSADSAVSSLGFMPQRAAGLLREIIRSAVANAQDKGGFDIDSLSVANILVDHGPMLKRFRARAMGRGARILKRTSHITVVLSEA